jgi:peptidoglycan hydrolase-like protein with peptidoglycan-binding domain
MKDFNTNKKAYTLFTNNYFIKYILEDYKDFLEMGKIFCKKEFLTNQEFLYNMFYMLTVWTKFKKANDDITAYTVLVQSQTEDRDLMLNGFINVLDTHLDNSEPVFFRHLYNYYDILLYNLNYLVPNIKHKKYFELKPWAYEFICLFLRYYVLNRVYVSLTRFVKDKNKTSIRDIIMQHLFRKYNNFRLDHVSSGLQIIGFLLNDDTLLEYTNVIQPKDKVRKTLTLTILDKLSNIVNKDYINVITNIINTQQKNLLVNESKYKVSPQELYHKSSSYYQKVTVSDIIQKYIPSTISTIGALENYLWNFQEDLKQLLDVYNRMLKDNKGDLKKSGIKKLLREIKEAVKITNNAYTEMQNLSKFTHNVFNIKSYFHQYFGKQGNLIENFIFSKATVKAVVMPKSYNASTSADIKRFKERLQTYLTYNYITIPNNDWDSFNKAITFTSIYIVKVINTLINDLTGGAVNKFQSWMKEIVSTATGHNGILIPHAYIQLIVTPKEPIIKQIKTTTYNAVEQKIKRNHRLTITHYSTKVSKSKLINSLGANLIHVCDSLPVLNTKKVTYLFTDNMIRFTTMHDAYTFGNIFFKRNSDKTIIDIDTYKCNSSKTYMLDQIRIGIYLSFKINPMHELFKLNNITINDPITNEILIPSTKKITKKQQEKFKAEMEHKAKNALSDKPIKYFADIENPFEDILASDCLMYLYQNKHKWSLLLEHNNSVDIISKPNKKLFLKSLTLLNAKEKIQYNTFIKTEILNLSDSKLLQQHGLFNTQYNKTKYHYIVLIEDEIKCMFIIKYLQDTYTIINNNIHPVNDNSLISKLRKVLNNDDILTY